MHPIKVKIDNWQDTPWTELWIPIIIAVISLIVSLYSIYLTRKQFTLSTRPYMQAAGFWDLDLKKILNDRFNISVTNSPAHIKSMEIKLMHKDLVFSERSENSFQFPVEGSTHYYAFKQTDMDAIMAAAIGDENNVYRSIEIIYTKLGGGKEYRTYMKNRFQGIGGTWEEFEQECT